MKIKNLLIIILVFIEPDKSFAIYKPIFSHFGYKEDAFLRTSFSTLPDRDFKNDFSLITSYVLKGNSGILLVADVTNKAFYPNKFKTIGIVPTKIFVENKLAVCWVKKIGEEEYFYSGPGVRSVDLANDKYLKDNFGFVNPASRGFVNPGFTIGYSRILKEWFSIATGFSAFSSRHQPFLYTLDINFVVADNLVFNIGNNNTNVHAGVSLINNWGRIGYRANYFDDQYYHSIFCGLSLNY